MNTPQQPDQPGYRTPGLPETGIFPQGTPGEPPATSIHPQGASVPGQPPATSIHPQAGRRADRQVRRTHDQRVRLPGRQQSGDLPGAAVGLLRGAAVIPPGSQERWTHALSATEGYADVRSATTLPKQS